MLCSGGMGCRMAFGRMICMGEECIGAGVFAGHAVDPLSSADFVIVASVATSALFIRCYRTDVAGFVFS